MGIALAVLVAGKSYPLITFEGRRIGDVTIATEQPFWYASPGKGQITIHKYYKVATDSILKNSPVVKDGCAIGIAAEPIEPGQVVHQCICDEDGRLIRTGGNIQEYPNLFSPPKHRLQSLSEHYEILREGLDRPPNFRTPDHISSREVIRAYPRIETGNSRKGYPGEDLLAREPKLTVTRSNTAEGVRVVNVP